MPVLVAPLSCPVIFSSLLTSCPVLASDYAPSPWRRAGTHSARTMKLMIMLLISLLLATGVEAAGSKKKCKKYNKYVEKNCPSPSPPAPPAAPPSPFVAFTFTSKKSLEKAVKAFNKKPGNAEKKYGPIAGWDVSRITDMSYLFYRMTKFNADISNWDTSGVTDMSAMFEVRSAARALPPHSPPVAGCPRARPLRPLLPHAL